MTSNELEQEVWELVDEHSMELGKQEYVDFLLGLAADARTRAEGVQQELEDENEETD